MIWKIYQNQNNGWIMCLELLSFYCACRMAVLHLSQKLSVSVMLSTCLQVSELSLKPAF